MTHEFEFHQLPEEIREAMERHQQLHQMQADDYRHSVQRFFDELDKDQLVTFRWMLRNMGMGGSQLAQYYEGQISQILYTKFNICPGCMVNHDEEVAEQLQGEHQKHVAASVGTHDPKQVPAIALNEDGTRYHTDTEIAQMLEYNIDDAYEEGTTNFLGYICKGCGTIYVSIEDRMLRAPDECSGCIQKAKWG